jgi:hypothetical protein
VAGDWAYWSDSVGNDRSPGSSLGTVRHSDTSGSHSESELDFSKGTGLENGEMDRTGTVTKPTGGASTSAYTIGLGLKAKGDAADDEAAGEAGFFGTQTFQIANVRY